MENIRGLAQFEYNMQYEENSEYNLWLALSTIEYDRWLAPIPDRVTTRPVGEKPVTPVIKMSPDYISEYIALCTQADAHDVCYVCYAIYVLNSIIVNTTHKYKSQVNGYCVDLTNVQTLNSKWICVNRLYSFLKIDSKSSNHSAHRQRIG